MDPLAPKRGCHESSPIDSQLINKIASYTKATETGYLYWLMRVVADEPLGCYIHNFVEHGIGIVFNIALVVQHGNKALGPGCGVRYHGGCVGGGKTNRTNLL